MAKCKVCGAEGKIVRRGRDSTVNVPCNNEMLHEKLLKQRALCADMVQAGLDADAEMNELNAQDTGYSPLQIKIDAARSRLRKKWTTENGKAYASFTGELKEKV